MFAQSALIDEMPKLGRFALKLTKNMSGRDDLVQSTCLRALEKADYFTDGSNLFSWTSKIMFNIFVSEYRRKARFETSNDSEEIIASQAVEPRQEMDMDIKRLDQAMSQLAPAHHQVIQKVYIEGWSYQEVAEQLNVPIGTVRSRLARARQHLVGIMNPAPITPL